MSSTTPAPQAPEVEVLDRPDRIVISGRRLGKTQVLKEYCKHLERIGFSPVKTGQSVVWTRSDQPEPTPFREL